MTEFVLWVANNDKDYPCDADFLTVLGYANLLKTPLSLEMFVAVKDGEVLQKPVPKSQHVSDYERRAGITEVSISNEVYQKEKQEYQEARKKILFKGWELDTSFRHHHLKNNGWVIDAIESRIKDKETIECLINDGTNLTGTDNFWNQIFKP